MIDVEQVLEIKRLLYEKRFTIEGARKFLESRPKTEPAPASARPVKRRAPKASPLETAKVQTALFDASGPALEAVRAELKEILKLLK